MTMFCKDCGTGCSVDRPCHCCGNGNPWGQHVHPQNARVRILLVIMLVVLAGALVARFLYLDADPPPMNEFGFSVGDEAYSHNARNRFLFGWWIAPGDHFNPVAIAPLYSLLVYGGFSVFGFSVVSARLTIGLVSVLGIIVSALVLRGRLRNIFVLLCMTNTIMIFYSRSATVEPLAIAMITVIVALLDAERPVFWGAAGVLTAGLLAVKVTTLSFVVATCALAVLAFFKSRRGIATAFAAGFAGGLGVLAFFLAKNFGVWSSVRASYEGWEGFSLVKVAGGLVYSAKFLQLCAALVIPFLIVWFVRSREGKNSRRTLLESYAWVYGVILLLQVFYLDYPIRRFVIMVPLLVYLLAKVLSRLSLVRAYGVVAIVAVLSLIPCAEYVAKVTENPEGMRTYSRIASEVGRVVPPGELLMGANGAYLFGGEWQNYNFIRHDALWNSEDEAFALLSDGTIRYALIAENLWDPMDIAYDHIDLSRSKSFSYLRDNFKVLRTFEGKDNRNDGRQLVYLLGVGR